MKYFTKANTILPVYSRGGDRNTLGGYMRRHADCQYSNEEIFDELLRVLNITGGRCVFTGREQWTIAPDGRYDFSALQVDHIHATRRLGMLTAGNIMLLDPSLNATKGAQHYSSIWIEDGPHHPEIPNLEALHKFMKTLMVPYAVSHPKLYPLNESYSLQDETCESLNATIDAVGLSTRLSAWSIADLYTEHKPAAARSMIDQLKALYELESKQWDDRPAQTQKNDFSAVKQLADHTDETVARAFIAGELSLDETVEMTIQVVSKLGKGYSAQQVARVGNTVLRRYFDRRQIEFTWAGVVTAKVVEESARRGLKLKVSAAQQTLWQLPVQKRAINSRTV